MQFEVGETVVYPHHGAATISEVKKRIIKGEEKLYLKLRVTQGDLTIEVPADNVDLVGVRDVIGKEGLDRVFAEAGFEWREAGCSMCLGMNPDQLAPGERCASTSNRNFEGRQGKGGRTHLVSPRVAAATAIRGTLSSPADLEVEPGRHAATEQEGVHA